MGVQLYCFFLYIAACHKLISSEEGKLPNAFVEIRTMTPPATSWSKHAQTEIIEVSFFKIIIKKICPLQSHGTEQSDGLSVPTLNSIIFQWHKATWNVVAPR